MYEAQKPIFYSLATESNEAGVVISSVDCRCSAGWFESDLGFEDDRDYNFSVFATVHSASRLDSVGNLRSQTGSRVIKDQVIYPNGSTHSSNVLLTPGLTAGAKGSGWILLAISLMLKSKAPQCCKEHDCFDLCDFKHLKRYMSNVLDMPNFGARKELEHMLVSEGKFVFNGKHGSRLFLENAFQLSSDLRISGKERGKH